MVTPANSTGCIGTKQISNIQSLHKRLDKSFDSTTSLRCQEAATFNLAVGMIAPDRPMLRSIASSTVTASIAAN
jgi:hypothetical protein